MANGFDSQAFADAHKEKHLGSYEGLFKESTFAKPQNIYLTITAQHIYGEAFVMEQQGTMEGDPVFQRFVVPLEEITKVYVNNRVKSSPLFVQCDNNEKGVMHRRRIILPSLENVDKIMDHIKAAHASYIKKYEEKMERERRHKKSELEKARLEEQENAQQAAPADGGWIETPPVVEEFPEAAPETVVPEAPAEAEPVEASAPEAPEPVVAAEEIPVEPVIPEPVPEPVQEQPIEVVSKPKHTTFEFTADLEEELKALDKISGFTGPEDIPAEDMPVINDPTGPIKGDIETIKAPKKRLKKAKASTGDDLESIDFTDVGLPKDISHGNNDHLEDLDLTGIDTNTLAPEMDISAPAENTPQGGPPDLGDELLDLPPIADIQREVTSAHDQLSTVEEALEEERRVEEARLAEEKRLAEEARLAEEKRLAEEAEAKRIAEEAKKAEEAARKAEAKRKADEAKKAEEAAKKAEEKRKAEEAKKAEEKHRADAAKKPAKNEESIVTRSVDVSGISNTSAAMSGFEEAMRALAAKRSSMSPEEYAAEKAKIIKTLY
ncbi:MAG: hypothetical protein II936_09105 [Oscillospiraceae bacterium]|nr:hypothetical protein [Oscillospiraceae bacterium]